MKLTDSEKMLLLYSVIGEMQRTAQKMHDCNNIKVLDILEERLTRLGSLHMRLDRDIWGKL